MAKKEDFTPNSSVIVDGTHIDTFKKEIVSANILEVEVGTTGYMGGDTGHGGRASPFSFLIDTIISINTIGFWGALAKCLFSASYKQKRNVKSTITTPFSTNTTPPYPLELCNPRTKV